MKNINIFSCCLLLVSLSVRGENQNTAVLDFQSESLTESEIITLSNELRHNLIKNNTYTLIERNRMKEILREQGFQQTGCTSSDCAVEIGELLGVKQLITGSIGKVGKLYVISVRCIDIKTGKILKDISHKHEGSIEEILTEVIPVVSKRLSGAADKAPVVKKEKNNAPLLWITGGTVVAGGAAAAAFFLLKSDNPEEEVENTRLEITW